MHSNNQYFLLKSFIKEIISDDFNKVLFESYNTKKSSHDFFVFREKDYFEPIPLSLMKTDIIISVLMAQKIIDLGKVVFDENSFIDFKNKLISKAHNIENLSKFNRLTRADTNYVESEEYYYDFIMLGVHKIYEIEDYMKNVEGSVDIKEIISDIMKFKEDFQTWKNEYFSSNINVYARTLIEKFNQIPELEKKIEFIEMQKWIDEISKKPKDEYLTLIGEKVQIILSEIKKYKLERTNAVNSFIETFKSLEYDDYKNADYKTIVNLELISKNFIYKRRVSNEEEETCLADIYFALARKIVKASTIEEKKEIENYYMVNLSSETYNKVIEEALISEFELAPKYERGTSSIFKTYITLSKKTLDVLFKNTKNNEGFIQIAKNLSRETNVLEIDIDNRDNVTITYLNKNPKVLEYDLLNLLRELREVKDLDIDVFWQKLDELGLRLKLDETPSREIRSKHKV